MTGQLYINDKDAWLTWGAFLVGDSVDNFLLPPSLKPYTENNFRSQHGKQVFIVNSRKEARDIQVEFCILAKTRAEYLIAYKNFVDELSDGKIIVKLPILNMELELYVSGFLSLGFYGKYGKLSVRFTESYSVQVIIQMLATELGQLILTEDDKTILI